MTLATFGILAMLLVSSNSASAVSQGASTSWPSWVKAPNKASCPKDSTPVLPTTGTTDSLGVAHIEYAKAPGFKTAIAPIGSGTTSWSNPFAYSYAASVLQKPTGQDLNDTSCSYPVVLAYPSDPKTMSNGLGSSTTVYCGSDEVRKIE